LEAEYVIKYNIAKDYEQDRASGLNEELRFTFLNHILLLPIDV